MKYPRTLAAAAAALLIAGGGWLMNREKSNGSHPSQGQSEINPAHEKVFLIEQLRRNPGHSPILLRLAQIEHSEGDVHAARQHLEQAIAAGRPPGTRPGVFRLPFATGGVTMQQKNPVAPSSGWKPCASALRT